jgi:O-antigen ligase
MQFIFFHPNQFAMTLAYLLVFLVGSYFMERSSAQSAASKGGRERWMLLALAVGFPAVLTTVSKNALFSCLAGSGLILMLTLLKHKQRRKSWFFIVLVPILLAVSLLVVQAITGISFTEALLNRLGDSKSYTWRLMTWNYLLSDLHWSTLWFGHGFSAAAERMQLFEPPAKGTLLRVLQVHNDYLQVLYDFGLAGLLLFFWLIGNWIKAILSAFRSKAEHPALPFQLTLLGLVTVFLICSATDNNLVSLESPAWLLITLTRCCANRLQYISELS